MPTPAPQDVPGRRHDNPLDRRQNVVRRTALLVAAFLVIALLAPFVAWQISG